MDNAEIVIAGGGPAGLAAAIYAARAGVAPVVLEGAIPGGRLVTLERIDNYPGFAQGIAGADLALEMRAQAERFGAKLLPGEELAAVAAAPGGTFEITAASGRSLLASSLIVATGTRPRRLGVPGEREFEGRGVSYCATCDGAFFKDRAVVVAGSGAEAYGSALYLARQCSRVVLLLAPVPAGAAKAAIPEAVRRTTRIEVAEDASVLAIEGEGRAVRAVRASVGGRETRIEASGVFVAFGDGPALDWAGNLFDLDDTGHIRVDADCATSLPGAFAAGDVAGTRLRQVATAVAMGATAATSALRFATRPAVRAKRLPAPRWEPGVFQIHFIHTGVAESMFLLFPDGTSMLLDCGDHPAITRGAKAVPVVPGPERLAGEWIARYVERANPRGRDVDWAVVSHFHSDHAGAPFWQKSPGVSVPMPGAPDEPPPLGGCARSGIGLAGEFLRFSRATDRGWPFYDDPPRTPTTAESRLVSEHVRATWSALHRRDGLVPEPFRLGASDQFVPLHGDAPGFSVRNVCANGRIALPDGTVRDLYAGPVAAGSFRGPLNENAMSLGMVFSLGRFRFAACGDFSDRFTLPDGREVFIEDDLADAVGAVDVAKINHHGHHSTGRKFAETLHPRVWIAPVWDNLHCTDDSMESILGGAAPGPDAPLVVPTVLPVRPDGERPWWRFVPDACRGGVHAVVSVRSDGESWALDLLDARTEEAAPVAHFDFATSEKP